jgi:hypothetical protein
VECVHAENLKRAANKGNDFCAFAEMKLSRKGREGGEGGEGNFNLMLNGSEQHYGG